MRRERHAQLRSKRPPQLLGDRERKRARGRRKLMPVIVHRRCLEKDGLCRSSRFRAGRARREKGPPQLLQVWSNEPPQGRDGYSVQPEAWSRRSRSIQSPWEATALSIASVACAGARRGRGMSLQPSLFTRLTAVEAELSAMKDILAELKVNQDELRRDRDEWRWRAERLLADLQQGTRWRWYNRAAAALDAGTARFRGVLADLQNRLSEMRASRGELRQGRDQRPVQPPPPRLG